MSKERKRHVSGPIFQKTFCDTREYMIETGGGGIHAWGIPVRNLDPSDLRELADDLERERLAGNLPQKVDLQ